MFHFEHVHDICISHILCVKENILKESVYSAERAPLFQSITGFHKKRDQSHRENT